MDDVLFTVACLKDYARRLDSGDPGSANDRLRDEVADAPSATSAHGGPRKTTEYRPFEEPPTH
jgi:hypothetical protein